MNSQSASYNCLGLASHVYRVFLMVMFLGLSQNAQAQTTRTIAQNPGSKLTPKVAHERRTYSPGQPLFMSKNRGVREHLHRNLGRTSAAANCGAVGVETLMGQVESDIDEFGHWVVPWGRRAAYLKVP